MKCIRWAEETLEEEGQSRRIWGVHLKIILKLNFEKQGEMMWN
jgi:hypothetical protein